MSATSDYVEMRAWIETNKLNEAGEDIASTLEALKVYCTSPCGHREIDRSKSDNAVNEVPVVVPTKMRPNKSKADGLGPIASLNAFYKACNEAAKADADKTRMSGTGDETRQPNLLPRSSSWAAHVART